MALCLPTSRSLPLRILSCSSKSLLTHRSTSKRSAGFGPRGLGFTTEPSLSKMGLALFGSGLGGTMSITALSGGAADYAHNLKVYTADTYAGNRRRLLGAADHGRGQPAHAGLTAQRQARGHLLPQ